VISAIAANANTSCSNGPTGRPQCIRALTCSLTVIQSNPSPAAAPGDCRRRVQACGTATALLSWTCYIARELCSTARFMQHVQHTPHTPGSTHIQLPDCQNHGICGTRPVIAPPPQHTPLPHCTRLHTESIHSSSAPLRFSVTPSCLARLAPGPCRQDEPAVSTISPAILLQQMGSSNLLGSQLSQHLPSVHLQGPTEWNSS